MSSITTPTIANEPNIAESSNMAKNAPNTIANTLVTSAPINAKRKASIEISDVATKKQHSEAAEDTQKSTVFVSYISWTTSEWNLPFDLNKAHSYRIKWDILNVQWEKDGDVVQYHPDEKDYADGDSRQYPEVVEINENRVKEPYFDREINRLKSEINRLKSLPGYTEA